MLCQTNGGKRHGPVEEEDRAQYHCNDLRSEVSAKTLESLHRRPDHRDLPKTGQIPFEKPVQDLANSEQAR